MNNNRKSIKLDNGKYEIVFDKNGQFPEVCLRNGEPWRNLVGDNLIFFLCAALEDQSPVGDMNKNRKSIKLDDGKYEIVFDENGQFPEMCLRNGEPWRCVTGDNLIFFLCAALEDQSAADTSDSSAAPAAPGKTICFTGRRPKDLLGYVHSEYDPLVHYVADIVIEYYKKGYTRFISGGAQGFDQLAFWAVNLARHQYPDIQNDLILPFKGQENRWLEHGPFGQIEYKQMLRNASNVTWLHESVQGREAIAALMERNRAMVDASDLVIALFPDDSWRTARFGGTANCMQYAAAQGKTIEQIRYTVDKKSCEWALCRDSVFTI